LIISTSERAENHRFHLLHKFDETTHSLGLSNIDRHRGRNTKKTVGVEQFVLHVHSQIAMSANPHRHGRRNTPQRRNNCVGSVDTSMKRPRSSSPHDQQQQRSETDTPSSSGSQEKGQKASVPSGDGRTQRNRRRRRARREHRGQQQEQNQIQANGQGQGEAGPGHARNTSDVVVKGETNRNPAEDEQEGGEPKVLLWSSPVPYVPLEVEESMVDVLVKWKKKERGMIKDQPPFRLDQIKRKCRQNDWKISLPQALSLRRHHIKLLNGYKSMPQLGLGGQDDIRESARLFEQAVEEYLVHRGVSFWTEAQQKAEFYKHAQPGQLLKVTPDFLLPPGTSLRVQKVLQGNDGNHSDKSSSGGGHGMQIIKEQVIHWIEAKMFYGASTIAHGTNSAVGSLMASAQKYVAAFGPGAIVFMYGCGDRLAADLAQVGVLVLDCSDSVPLDIVQDHQKTWCANQQGEILP
jgi:hypothetical protein